MSLDWLLIDFGMYCVGFAFGLLAARFVIR